MTINRRDKMLMIIAGAVIAMLACDHLVVGPLWRTWKARAERIADLRRQVDNGTQRLPSEKISREMWAKMRTHTLPADVSVAENQVLKSVDQWARDSRISFTSIKPQWKQVNDEYTTLECRADAFGNLQTMAQFVYDLEVDPLPLKIEELSIMARDTEGQQLSLAVRFSGLQLAATTK